MRRFLNRLTRLLGRRNDSLVIYTYSPRQGSGKTDEHIQEYGRGSFIPHEVRKSFVRARGRTSWWMARLRILRGATLLYLSESGGLDAYGWIQRHDPLHRRYRFLAPRATILGYFWTSPGCRGKGLYGRLLAHCIAACPDRRTMPLIVYAVPGNPSSLRGLDKARFARLGVYEVRSGWLGLSYSHRVISQERTIRAILAEGADPPALHPDTESW